MAKDIDWQLVELAYTQSERSLREIANSFPVSHVTIRQHAKTHGWLRPSERDKREAVSKAASVTAPASEASAPVVDRPDREANFARVRQLYEHTPTDIAGVIIFLSITQEELDNRIKAEGWVKFDPKRRAAPSGSSEYRDGAMHATAADAASAPSVPGVPFTGIVPEPPPRVDLTKIRAPRRAVSTRDKPPVEFHKARKLKPSALAEMGRDAAMAYIAQLRDLIGNQDIIDDMLKEWSADHTDDDGVVRPKGKFEMLENLHDMKELGLMLKSAGAAYRAFCEGEGFQGKKDRQNEDAAELAKTSPFAQQAPPPRLAVADGKPV